MSSTQFAVDLQDIKFTLFDVLDVDVKLAAIERFSDFDKETYEALLDEAARIATEVLAPINGPGDRQGCRLDGDGNVTTPDGYKAAWEIFAEGGWVGMTASPEVGGVGLPQGVGIACTEMFSGSATAFAMYGGLTAGAARVVHQFGPEGWAIPVATKMFTGEWGGTMCLTEAGAGTEVGDNRTKATPTGNPGEYLLEGEKIFISGGDQDLTENIVHLVLARTPDAPAGSKGISIFLVPKYVFDDDMNIGERNDARVVGIEHKMGINGSATCVLALGTNGPCKGWLMGEEGQGLPIMFKMMNEARVGVGVQGESVAAAATMYATAYAKERVQGTSIDNFKDADAPRVSIVEHPDVRRMLMQMKVLTETMRSLTYRIALYSDLAESDEVDEAERQRYQNRADLLVPIVKAHCTDLGFDVCVTGVQVLGGYGYVGEYPLEQLVRDAKIMSIYEGTNGIQAMDLLGRKMRMRGGMLFMEWLQDSQKLVADCAADFPDETAAIGKAIGHVGATAMHLGGLGAKGQLANAMLQATPFQSMMGHVVLALEALDQARIAKARIDAGDDTDFLYGKLLNLRFFVNNLLPSAVALGKAIQTGDDSCMDERLFAS
jgi:alkylation response protein AidB-like acyl-CoA dehydrogenase